ncbi:MAG: putative Ig domain-containing protein, partial [Bacteroidales bacterium]|nr:putative Ig domain-containing protein [Bacteroidales bacterium]
LDIYMAGGDFNNSGTFTASGNKVYFTADTTQSINGITTFYDLYKTTGTDTLKLGANSEITVNHYLSLESGLFFDNGNNVNVKGNLNNLITTLSSGTGNGIVLNGTAEQTITGSGTYARLTTDNPANMTIPTGYNITVTDSLQLKQGVLDIGKNLLILTKNADIIEASPFSESNMISTNISFTDAGVKKYFPIINSSTVFTYPMGSAGKYTPVTFDITANGNDTASIRIRAANERHPSIIEDSEAPNTEIPDTANVLWYYWTIDANGIDGFTATATMQSYASDAYVTSPYTTADYITARLLNASLGTWDKFTNLDYNEATSELYFYYSGTNDQGIDGDYTAGIDDAIPDKVPSYITIANGDWSDATIWDTYPTSGGSVPAGGPRGSIVYIQHTVTTPANFVSAYITRMLAPGVLNLGTTFGHRLGFVSGTGKIYLESGDLPAGVYDDFFAADSGTIEYGGANAIDILSEITAVNNLILSGSNDRILPNLDLVIRGNLTINGPDVKNTHNESVELRKDLTFAAGTFDAGFDDGADVNNGMFIIGGSTTQHIYGPATFTGTNAFNHFKMNNPVGIVLDQPVDIDNQLVFVSGPITTSSTNILTLHNTATDIVTGAGAGNYVDGPLKKNIINGQGFNFPTGNAGRYGNIRVFNTGTTGNEYWIAQYYNDNPGNAGYDPTVYNAPLQTVSDNEYWRVYSPVATTAQVELRWDSQSGMPTDAANVANTRIAEWRNTVPQWEEVDANNTISAAGSTGTVTSTVNSSFNEWTSTGNIFTLSTTYVSQDFTWDGSQSVVWNDAANWYVNLVPTALDSVIIASGMPNDPTISIDAVCGGMDLQAGATLTINSGASLTLSGDLVMNGDVLLKSDANGTGVLIDNGNIGGTGTATVERFLSGSKFHYISAPLSAIPHTTYYAQLPGETQVNTNYYWYDETNSNSNWLYGWVAQNGTGNMIVNRGYAYYYTKDYTFVQTGGSFNTGNLSVTVTNSNNGVGSDGWNLIGNPYPSTILADEFIYNNNSVIDGTLYFWDDPGTNGSYVSSDYATWNLAGAVGTGSGTASNSITPDGYIGVGQSFFVHTNAGGTVNFTNSMRRIGNGQFFKDAAYDGVGRLKLSISNDATRMYNELLIAFIDGASDNFDNLYDGKKIKGNPDIAFYSKLNGEDYAIQSFAPLSAFSEKVVDLGFDLSNSNTYVISVQQFENFDPAVKVSLIDKMLDSVIDLRSQNTYTFTSNAGTFADRFEVVFNYQPANDGFTNRLLLNLPIADTMAIEDSNFEYRLAENTFLAANLQDTLTYKATLFGEFALPAWLSFNPNTLTFSGTPENKDVDTTLIIKLTANDLNGDSVYDEFVLRVVNVNDAPELVNAIPNQSIIAGEDYSYIVPQNTFTDVDKGDRIVLSAKLADGSSLPDWLNFDEQSGKLYGTAASIGDYRIMITATDIAGASTSDEFTLSVKSITGINRLSESKVSIYPNPTTGKFVIETNYYSDDLDIIIRDNQGRIIKQMKPQSKNTDVDISTYSSGLYFIELRNKEESIVHKINLNK